MAQRQKKVFSLSVPKNRRRVCLFEPAHFLYNAGYVRVVLLLRIPPLLYRAALLYYCCCLASKLSFAKMFEVISKYQPDPELRWKQCVRVKRGIADTSKPNGIFMKYLGMYKDQIYFLGALEILKNRKKLNFIHMYSGKISVQDCLRLS